jgi:integrase
MKSSALKPARRRCAGNPPPRAITLEEHQKIITAEVNLERKTLYQLCWHLGASQGDIASLKGEDVDWTDGTVSFTRKKTGVPVLVHLGGEALNLFKELLRRL